MKCPKCNMEMVVFETSWNQALDCYTHYEECENCGHSEEVGDGE